MTAAEELVGLGSLFFQFVDPGPHAFAGPVFALLDSFGLDLASDFASRIEDVIVDVRYHVKHAQLMLSFGSDFGDGLGILPGNRR